MVENLIDDKRKKEIQGLKKAFKSFSNTSKKLQDSYDKLQARIKDLDSELAEKNHELEQNLKEKDQVKNYLHNILESLTTGVMVVDRKGEITTFNQSAGTITRYDAEKALGKQLKDVFPEDLVSEVLEPLVRSKDKTKSFERIYTTSNGHRIDLRISASPMASPEDQESGTVLIIQDITQLKFLEDEIQRSQRLSAMGEMAAGIAHEIRNPLGSIELFASLLEKDLAGDDDKQILANHICNGVKSMDRIISSILLFARSPEPAQKKFSINDLLNELLEFSTNIVVPENIRIFRDLDSGNPMVRGDSDLLKQVFLNLIRNGIQAMPGGGELRITSCENIDGTESEKKVNRFVTITVSDTGIGIPPQNLQKIFNPFFTTKARGTGLGMAIAYNIIKAHQGTIEVESQENQGSRFVVKIPNWSG